MGNQVLFVLGDPLGIGALEPLTGYWTAAEQNSRLIGIPAVVAWNRVTWLAAAVAVLAALHRRFRLNRRPASS